MNWNLPVTLTTMQTVRNGRKTPQATVFLSVFLSVVLFPSLLLKVHLRTADLEIRILF